MLTLGSGVRDHHFILLNGWIQGIGVLKKLELNVIIKEIRLEKVNTSNGFVLKILIPCHRLVPGANDIRNSL